MNLVKHSRPVPSTVHVPTPWPTLSQYLAAKRTRRYNLGRRIKSCATLWRAAAYKGELTGLFRSLPWAAQMFSRYPGLFRAALDHFLDIRHPMRQRFALLMADLRSIDQLLTPEQLRPLSGGQALCRWRSEELDLQVDLSLNLEAKEGLWRLGLRQIDSEAMVYSLSFAFVGDALFIGAVQGTACQDAPALIRQATKALHGLRPPFFLIEILRSLARQWNVRRIVGVDGNFQLKANKGSRDSDRVRFDYAAFWTELGGARSPQGNWDIPLVGSRKSLDEIESRKRAMYRRRFELLDGLNSIWLRSGQSG